MIVLSLAWFAFFVFGLGGTTPIPQFVMGTTVFNIVTFEKFIFWSLLLLMPIAGQWLAFLLKRSRRIFYLLLSLYVIFFSYTVVRDANDPPNQKDLDVSGPAKFLNTSPNNDYRYLTLGFADMMAKLGIEADAQCLDGNYNKIRWPEIVRIHPVLRLDSAKYCGEETVEVLDVILASPERYSLKFVFSTDEDYNVMLLRDGWVLKKVFPDGISLWESGTEAADTLPVVNFFSVPPKSRSIPPVKPVGKQTGLEAVWWGVASPILFLLFVVCSLIKPRSICPRRS